MSKTWAMFGWDAEDGKHAELIWAKDGAVFDDICYICNELGEVIEPWVLLETMASDYSVEAVDLWQLRAIEFAVGIIEGGIL